MQELGLFVCPLLADNECLLALLVGDHFVVEYFDVRHQPEQQLLKLYVVCGCLFLQFFHIGYVHLLDLAQLLSILHKELHECLQVAWTVLKFELG